MANAIEKVNGIAIADIEAINGITDANLQALNGLEFTGAGPFITATGGSIATNGDYKVHTFAAGTNNFVVTGLGTDATYGNKVEFLIVAGGGGGGGGGASGAHGSGGGGAGRVLLNDDYTVSAQTYVVTVGAGGAGGNAHEDNGSTGSNSKIAISGGSDVAECPGGGYGGHASATVAGGNGGSGGGGSGNGGCEWQCW